MRVGLLWSRPSGYMAACWAALEAVDVALNVIALRPGIENNSPFEDSVFSTLPLTLISDQEARDRAFVSDLVTSVSPDLLLVSGWWNPVYRSVARAAGIPYIVLVDNPMRQCWHPAAVRLRYGRYLSRAAAVAVPGERGWQLIQRAGVPRRRIITRLYGIAPLSADTTHSDRAFLFAGQCTRRKGFDVLIAAYKRYRDLSRQPFDLWVAGEGPLLHEVDGVPGIRYFGFVQPAQLAQIRSAARFLVLASRYDPWPLVIAEAAQSGLGIVCTSACGSVPELVRDGWNGRVVPPDDASSLAGALHWAEGTDNDRADIADRSRALAAPYEAHAWADHWKYVLTTIANGP
jgi:glycosyltransferase involved in cell wall biosynthesis